MEIISFAIDGVILALLGVTIFYAGRLSTALKNFREGRKEFETVLKSLDESIAAARNSIHSLREITEDAGHDLQLKINESRSISEELQLVNEAAQNLANRLETLATTRSRNAESDAKRSQKPLELGLNTKTRKLEKDNPDFSLNTHEKEKQKYDNQDTDNTKEIMSKAEKDLASALQKMRK